MADSWVVGREAALASYEEMGSESSRRMRHWDSE